jgi:23S rRNA (adenine2030-N6)-methyltransferase
MLSYRHHYHAGNHGDVFKHIALTLILTAMKRKEKPMLYLDTHSGAGVYDLKGPMAQKINEQAQGILKIWGRGDIPESVQPYIRSLERMNPSGKLTIYPGSPWIAHQLLDEKDRLVLNELHSTDVRILADVTRHFRNMKVFHQDGLLQLNALLPPPEKRGLIFIDPSYEIKSDYVEVAHAVLNGLKKFNNGVFAIWYPLLKSGIHYPLLDLLAEVPDIHRIECRADVERTAGMYGSGLLLINPPFQVDKQIRDVVRWLAKVM